MRFLLDQQSYEQMAARKDHTPDCYVRPGEYLHHIYVEGIKYVVARALAESLKEATAKKDAEAYRHLQLHKEQFDMLMTKAQQKGGIGNARLLGDPPPAAEEGAQSKVGERFVPPAPTTLAETGLNRAFMSEMILRTIYNRGRATGSEIGRDLRLTYEVIGPLLAEMRQGDLIDIVGQAGLGDVNYEYVLRPPRGPRAVEDALKKTEYSGPAPVPFKAYIEAVKTQTVKNITVTRRTIRQAFSDLVIADAVLNEIGPAVNSGSSIFFFGFPGNGKTSIAERITRLMGDDIFIPYAIDVDGQIIKLFDSVVHELVKEDAGAGGPGPTTGNLLEYGPPYDLRWAKIKRPVVVTGGELTLPALDLSFNELSRFYEAPFQMKANGGIFMIDDFGRQQVRAMDLLNRWIVPLEKRYDYLTTVTGKKLEIPFDQLLIFSTNLDPNQLADEAFLRRIKFKIEIRDPDEAQWRKIWSLVCKAKGVEVDPKALDYLIEKWYKPMQRPLRMCQPRDILDQMISIAKYNMEQVSFAPDLIDAACGTYFVSATQKDFGAAVRMS
jgi:hypothetical protein